MVGYKRSASFPGARRTRARRGVRRGRATSLLRRKYSARRIQRVFRRSYRRRPSSLAVAAYNRTFGPLQWQKHEVAVMNQQPPLTPPNLPDGTSGEGYINLADNKVIGFMCNDLTAEHHHDHAPTFDHNSCPIYSVADGRTPTNKIEVDGFFVTRVQDNPLSSRYNTQTVSNSHNLDSIEWKPHSITYDFEIICKGNDRHMEMHFLKAKKDPVPALLETTNEYRTCTSRFPYSLPFFYNTAGPASDLDVPWSRFYKVAEATGQLPTTTNVKRFRIRVPCGRSMKLSKDVQRAEMDPDGQGAVGPSETIDIGNLGDAEDSSHIRPAVKCNKHGWINFGHSVPIWCVISTSKGHGAGVTGRPYIKITRKVAWRDKNYSKELLYMNTSNP